MSQCVHFKGGQFAINQKTSLESDPCSIQIDEQESMGPGKYVLSNFHSCQCGGEDARAIAYEQPTVNFKDGFGWGSMNGCKVDDDSQVRLGCKHTNPRLIQQLYHRPYLTVPYMGNGCYYPDKESSLQFSEQTNEKRSCNVLAGVTIDRFIPMIDCLEENVQNPKNLIEETYDWVRGGEATRRNLKDVDYKRRCTPHVSRGPMDPNLGSNEV